MHCARPSRRHWRELLLSALIGTSGCSSVADRIAMPDPGVRVPSGKLAALEDGMGITRRSAALRSGVSLSWREIPAAERGFWIGTSGTEGGGLAFAMGTRKGRADMRPVPRRGSIVYLHGWRGEATAMLPWALAFAERGYRGVAVDLRGHGGSDDAPPGYGPVEARDTAELVEMLVASGAVTPPLYLVGVSYGATTALFAEPLLRGWLGGVIALEPFTNAADGIRGGVRGWSRMADSGVRGKLARWMLRDQMTAEGIEQAIDEAGRRLGVDLRRIDAGDVLGATRTCTLLVHGTNDEWVPPHSTRALAARSSFAHFLPVEGADHLTLPLRVDLLAAPLADWMQEAAAGKCAGATLPRAAPPASGARASRLPHQPA